MLLSCFAHLLKAQIFPGIVKTDVPHQRSQKVLVIRQRSIFDIASNQIAKNTAKVFMPRKGHE